MRFDPGVHAPPDRAALLVLPRQHALAAGGVGVGERGFLAATLAGHLLLTYLLTHYISLNNRLYNSNPPLFTL